jgi:G3E family GTPase
VNDFGAINIDKDLIKVETSDQIELTNGCVCCSIRDDLASGLVALGRSDPPFTRVVLECSGVSHPAGVLAAFDLPAVSAQFHVDGIFCLIDCATFEDLDFQSTELAIDQAAYSDLVLLNKADLADAERIASIARTLRGAQPHMRMFPAERADVPLEVLFGPQERTIERPPISTSTIVDHDEMYSSLAYAWHRPLTVGEFAKAAECLPAGVIRAKGILHVIDADHPGGARAVYQLVGKRSSLTFEIGAPPPESRLVLIGRSNAVDLRELEEILASCAGGQKVATAQHGHHHPHS